MKSKVEGIRSQDVGLIGAIAWWSMGFRVLRGPSKIAIFFFKGAFLK